MTVCLALGFSARTQPKKGYFMTSIFSKARLGLTCAALAVALTACVPIPVAQRNYVPNAADITVVKSHGGGCTLNSTFNQGVVKTLNATLKTSLRTVNADSPQAYALYSVVVTETPTKGRFSDVSLLPSRITLTEKDRTLTARLQDKNVYTQENGKARHSRFELRFPTPSGVAQTLTLTSLVGAVRIGGRAMPASTVRYDLNTSPDVYLFPCIPA